MYSHRPRADLIELFLRSGSVSRHRILTLFVERLTGFKITDAVQLEASEPPISLELSSEIQLYQPICEFDHLCKEPNGQCNIPFFLLYGPTASLIGGRLIQSLIDALIEWTLGSQPTSIRVAGDMRDLIALGVGSMDEFDHGSDEDNHVYISEPLVVLSLSSLFEKQSWRMRRTCFFKSFRNARSDLLGFKFEEVALVLMEIFGGKFNSLGDAFHCTESLRLRRVTMVSLNLGADGVVQSNPVSWQTGSSDRLGLKANSPADVLSFLHNPNGKAFLFPHAHIKPGLMCYLQDEETKELIVVALQGEISSLDVTTWESSIKSLTPQFFYRKLVGIKSCNCSHTYIFIPGGGETWSICTGVLPKSHK